MNESSIIQNMLESLAESLTSDELDRLCEIHLKVGELSGIEPVLLQSAFAGVIHNTDFENVVLHIDLIPITAKCPNCDKVFTVVHQNFMCSYCNTPTQNIQTGKELIIDHVIMEEAI